MPDENIIQSFLVSLGYKLDEGQQRKFDAALAANVAHSETFDKVLTQVGKQLGVLGTQLVELADRPTRKASEAADQIAKRQALLQRGAKELGLTAIATTGAFVTGFTEIARQYQNLYYVSQRTGESAGRLASLQFAGPQIGVAASAMVQATEALATAARNPGMAAFLHSWGVVGRDGKLADDALMKFVGHVRTMPAYLQDAYAQMFGVPIDLMRNMINNWSVLQKAQEDYARRARQAGLDLTQTAKDATEATRTLETIWSQLGIVAAKGFEEAFPAVKGIEDEVAKLLDLNIKLIGQRPGLGMAESFAAAAVSATSLLTVLGKLPGLKMLGVTSRLGWAGLGLAASAGAGYEFGKWAQSTHPNFAPGIPGWELGGGFAKGGIVPETGPIFAHANEMVLPPDISAGLQSLFQGHGVQSGFIDHFLSWLMGSTAYRPFVQVLGLTPGTPGAPGSSLIGAGGLPIAPNTSPAAAVPPGAHGDALRMATWLRSNGFSADATAAIMGNASVESSFSPRAGLGTAHQGLFQWDSNRWQGGGFDAQMRHMLDELNQIDPAFRGATGDPGALAARFEREFERSGGQMLVQRIVRARALENIAATQLTSRTLGGSESKGNRSVAMNQTNHFHLASGGAVPQIVAALNDHAGRMLRNAQATIN